MPTILDVTSRLATLARLLRTAAPDPAAVADHARGVVAAADELLAGDLAPLTHVGAVLNAVRVTVVVLTHPDSDIAHSPSEFNAYFPPYVEESGLSLREFVDMETRWCALNERRLDLIELEVAQSIESVEVEELERLQLIADVKFRPLHQEAMRRLDLEVSKNGW